MVGLGFGTQAERCLEQNLVAAAQVLDIDGGHGAVGNCEQRAFVGADAGGAESDIFHGAGAVAEAAGVTDADDFIAQDGNSAEKILDCFLGAEADGQTSDAEAGKGSGHVESQSPEHGEHSGHKYDRFDDAFTQKHERSGAGVSPGQGAIAYASQRPSDGAPGNPGEADD